MSSKNFSGDPGYKSGYFTQKNKVALQKTFCFLKETCERISSLTHVTSIEKWWAWGSECHSHYILSVTVSNFQEGMWHTQLSQGWASDVVVVAGCRLNQEAVWGWEGILSSSLCFILFSWFKPSSLFSSSPYASKITSVSLSRSSSLMGLWR